MNEKHVSPSTRYIVLVSLNYVAVMHDNECRYQLTRVYSTLSAETAQNTLSLDQSPVFMYICQGNSRNIATLVMQSNSVSDEFTFIVQIKID